MKICIWTSKLFALGGTRRVVTILANELSKEHDVTIMTHENRKKEDRQMYDLNENVYVDFIESYDFRREVGIMRLLINNVIRKINDRTGFLNKDKYTDFFSKIIYPSKMQNRWSEYINGKGYDVVIATATFSLMLGVLAGKLKAKTIGWQHSSCDAYFNTENLYFWKKERLFNKYIRCLDRYVVLNKYDVAEIKNMFNLNAVEINNPCTIFTDNITDYRNKNFLIAARFQKAKGVDLAIDAFNEFCKYDNEWNLIVVGDGKDRRKVINKVWNNNLQERVKFVGVTNDVEKYYRQASVYLMSSRWEGWGLVVVEAFKMGLPVIAFDIIPMDLIIDNRINGFIINKYDINEYAEYMLMIAQNEKMRKQMSINAANKAGEFTIKKFNDNWCEMFEEILKK